MPLQQFECQICGAKAPRKLLSHGQMAGRMKWLRDHRKSHHPRAFKASIKKGVATRRRHG